MNSGENQITVGCAIQLHTFTDCQVVFGGNWKLHYFIDSSVCYTVNSN